MVFELAAKCSPDEKILADIKKAGIKAVEIFLSKDIFKKAPEAVKTCKKFNFRYAIHAPNDDFNPALLSHFASEIKSEIVVFHDIFWEDEWREMIESFKNIGTKLCIENITGVYEASKFIRRYDFGRCFDIEHAQLEALGLYAEEVFELLKQASHIHLSGYFAGSEKWHTHVHQSEKHGKKIFDMIDKAGYNGMVVSEARVSLQKYTDFKKLKDFYDRWIKERK